MWARLWRCSRRNHLSHVNEIEACGLSYLFLNIWPVDIDHVISVPPICRHRDNCSLVRVVTPFALGRERREACIGVKLNDAGGGESDQFWQILLWSVLLLNGLSTFSLVHLTLLWHVIILSQGMLSTLSLIYFLMRSMISLMLSQPSFNFHAMHGYAFFSSLPFDALHITHVYASILCTVY